MMAGAGAARAAAGVRTCGGVAAGAAGGVPGVAAAAGAAGVGAGSGAVGEAGLAGAGFVGDVSRAAGAAAEFRSSSRAFGLATGEEWALTGRGASARGVACSITQPSRACDEDVVDRISGLVDDLARHMLAEGELSADGSVHVPDDGLEDAPVFEQRAKLVLMEGVEGAYVVPSGQDWAHDALGDAAVIAGMLYSDGEAFLPGEACVDGYFQADFDGRWVRVVRGRACSAGAAIAWRSSLEEFPELVAELSRYAEEGAAGVDDAAAGAVEAVALGDGACEAACDDVCGKPRCDFADAAAFAGVRRSA